MKHLKTYRIFENQNKDNSKIVKELKKYDIIDYTINNDGTIDVDGDVDLSYKRLTKIPLKFGKVTGNFYCNNNKLVNLSGCPQEVGIEFNCSVNLLKDLIGGPQEVVGDYYCYDNHLISLEGCSGDIGGDMFCYTNKLEMLDCSSVINGDISCEDNGFKIEPEFFGICGGKINWK